MANRFMPPLAAPRYRLQRAPAICGDQRRWQSVPFDRFGTDPRCNRAPASVAE